MSPVTHFLSGWIFANCFDLDRKDRALVTLACVIPDIDGLGIIPELLTSQLHASTLVVFAVSPFASHVGIRVGGHSTRICHCLAEVDDQPARPRQLSHPFARRYPWIARARWRSVANPISGTFFGSSPVNMERAVQAQRMANVALTIVLLAITLWLARRRGFSPLEMLSLKADHVFVSALRERMRRSGASFEK
jgi:inner membrane protein